MKLINGIQILIRLHHLISRKATGCPESCAKKLNISRSALYRYLDNLKYYGAPIHYCQHRKSFVYESEFELNFDKY